MKKQTKLLALLLGVASLCGCSTANGDEADVRPTIIDTDEIKEGYYLSEQGDDSYFLIKDGKYTLVGFDWEKEIRNGDLPEGIEMDTSEYEEYVSASAEDNAKDYTDKAFIPVKFYGYPKEANLPETMLVTNVPADKIESSGFLAGIGMKDENTLFITKDLLYTYCGASLPESE